MADDLGVELYRWRKGARNIWEWDWYPMDSLDSRFGGLFGRLSGVYEMTIQIREKIRFNGIDASMKETPLGDLVSEFFRNDVREWGGCSVIPPQKHRIQK